MSPKSMRIMSSTRVCGSPPLEMWPTAMPNTTAATILLRSASFSGTSVSSGYSPSPTSFRKQQTMPSFSRLETIKDDDRQLIGRSGSECGSSSSSDERLEDLALEVDPSTSPVKTYRRSRNRRQLERYRTMPITFEEISEVDEEAAAGNAMPLGDSGGGTGGGGGRSPYSLRGLQRQQLSPTARWMPSVDGAPPRKSSAPLPPPLRQVAGGSPRRPHWRSTESLLRDKRLVSTKLLPAIPELPGSPAGGVSRTPMPPAGSEDSEEEDDYVPEELKRTYTQ